jgi:dienelactone hydrolase
LSTIGIKGGVAYYPNCRPSAHTGLALPALVLIGDKDDWNSAENCRVLQSLMPKRPTLLDIVYYQTAHHGFDDVTMLPGRTYFGHRIEYDRSASHDAIERTRTFLDRLLR